MYASVTKVAPREDFSLFISLDTGEEGILDIKPYLGLGVFEQLKDYERFKKVRVAFDTVEWDCGVDLDPEFIAKHMRKTVPR